MKYESLGWLASTGGRKPKCAWCEVEKLSLRLVQEIESGAHATLCEKCFDEIREETSIKR